VFLFEYNERISLNQEANKRPKPADLMGEAEKEKSKRMKEWIKRRQKELKKRIKLLKEEIKKLRKSPQIPKTGDQGMSVDV
jgi:hypothetical protein